MPITRTPIVDDSGGGTDGTVIDNAWKQEFYNQIDAVVGPTAPVYGNFTGVDISGGLGNVGSGTYVRIGRLWVVFLSINYPVNANGANAAIGGLPFAQGAAIYGGLYEGFGATQYRSFIMSGTNVLNILDAVTGAYRTNAHLSGQGFHLHGVCLTD